MKNTININDFQRNDTVKGIWPLTKLTKSVKSDGKSYFRMTLKDATGQIQGVMWEPSETQLNNIKAGMLVEITGSINEYRDSLQLTINTLNEIPAMNIDDALTRQLVGEPILSWDEFINRVLTHLEHIEDPIWKQIVKRIYNDYASAIYASPAAATMHHDMYGGLALHTLTMTDVAYMLSEKVYKQLYPQLNTSLLVAATMLHDIGKTIELSGALGTVYTTEGILKGHIIIGYEIVMKTAIKLGIDPDCDKVNLLEHAILGHHGKLEWGSPVTPAFIEAKLLHDIDKMDADVQEFKKAELELSADSFMNGRYHGQEGRIYRPSIHEKETL